MNFILFIWYHYKNGTEYTVFCVIAFASSVLINIAYLLALKFQTVLCVISAWRKTVSGMFGISFSTSRCVIEPRKFSYFTVNDIVDWDFDWKFSQVCPGRYFIYRLDLQGFDVDVCVFFRRDKWSIKQQDSVLTLMDLKVVMTSLHGHVSPIKRHKYGFLWSFKNYQRLFAKWRVIYYRCNARLHFKWANGS